MPRELELKIFEDSDIMFVEVASMADWAPALRTLIKQFEIDAERGIPFKGKGIYVKIGDRLPVKVSPLFPSDGEINRVSIIQTYDDTYNNGPLSTLAAFKRIKKKPEFILASLNAEGYNVADNSDENNQIKRHADIAAVEHGISEQAYGGRTAIIATMMIHRYGKLLIENEINGRPTGKFNKQGEEIRVAYHTVYLGTGKGSAAILAAHQNYTQKVKIREFNDEDGNPAPSIIAAQLEAIYNDLIVLSEELRNTILGGVVVEAENAIEALYTEEGTDEDNAIVANLKRNLQETVNFIKQEGNKLLSVGKAKFETASTIKDATEFKTRARSRSDAGDSKAKGEEKLDTDVFVETKKPRKIGVKAKREDDDDSADKPRKKKRRIIKNENESGISRMDIEKGSSRKAQKKKKKKRKRKSRKLS